jgi:hypothetical protein
MTNAILFPFVTRHLHKLFFLKSKEYKQIRHISKTYVFHSGKRFVEFEKKGMRKLKHGTHPSPRSDFPRPHSQRGFGRLFHRPAQGDERRVDQAARTTHHHIQFSDV